MSVTSISNTLCWHCLTKFLKLLVIATQEDGAHIRNCSQSVNYAETGDAESDLNTENRIIVCALLTTELGNGCGRGRGRERKPNRPNEHMERKGGSCPKMGISG